MLSSPTSTRAALLLRSRRSTATQIPDPLKFSPSPSSSPSTFEWNTRLKNLVKLQRLPEARSLFAQIPRRDAVSFTTLLSGYVAAGDSISALRLFSILRSSSLSVDSFLLSLVLKSCALGKLRSIGTSLHAYSEKSGIGVSSIFVATALLDMYSKVGDLDSSLQLFDEMPQRNVVSWTSIITSLVHSNRFCQALDFFARMINSGIRFDSHTIAIVLKACADSGSLLSGREIHGEAMKLGLDKISFVSNALSSMYFKCEKPNLGFLLFLRMPSPDVVSWTSLISSYLSQGLSKSAIEAFLHMIKDGKVLPNDYTYSATISACAELGELRIGEQLHARTLRAGLAQANSVANALISLYSISGLPDEAEAVFQGMNSRDFVTWSALICGQAREGRIEKSFDLIRAMIRSGGLLPNEVAVGSSLSGCGAMAMLPQGLQLHAFSISTGLDAAAMVRSSLISMYSRCGVLHLAGKVFDEIPKADLDLVTWTAMIGGYAEHGCGRKAIDLFEQMLENGFTPDDVTFLSVLSACCHEGFVGLGIRYFGLMTERFKVEPKKEHYGCVVDLLCRAGEVGMAESLLETLPLGVDDGVAWSMLLRACRVDGEAERGRRAAERVLATQPRCGGTHAELCNLLAAAGRWGEAAEARKRMRERGVRKEKGSSWIDVGGEVAVFGALDQAHGETERIYAMLDVLVDASRGSEEEDGWLLDC